MHLILMMQIKKINNNNTDKIFDAIILEIKNTIKSI